MKKQITEIEKLKVLNKESVEQSQPLSDFTENELLINNLLKSEASLKQQNELLKALLKNIPIGVFMVEAPSGKPLLANEAALDILGRGILPDATKHNLSEVYRAHKKGSREPYPHEEMPIVLGMGGKTSHIEDMVVDRGDGTETLLEIFGSPVTDEQGHVWASIVSFFDITERKKTEDALIESEKHLRESQKVAQLGSYEWNLSTGLWSSSKILDDIFGIDENYIRSLEGWSNIIHPKWQVVMTDYVINNVLGKRQPFDMEYKIIRKNDSQERWVHGRGELVLNKEDQPISLIGTISDITWRKSAEENSLFINKAIESISDAIGISDANGRHFYQNKALSDLFGYANADEIDAAGGGAIVVKDPEVGKEMFSNIMSGKSWYGELDMITKSGRVFPAYERADAIKDSEGNIVGLIGIITDITERKQAEEILRKNEQMLKTVLDHFPGVVFWKDAQLNYLGCNHAFAFGAGLNSPDEIIGKTDFDLPWATTEAENYRSDDFQVMNSGIAKLHIVEMQHQTEGHVIWLDTSKIPIRDSNGKVIGVIGVSNDITDMKQTHEVISAKNKELENYLYVASHDLRSPLVNIQGFSQRLLKQTETIKTILSNCEIKPERRVEINKITNESIPKTLDFILSNVAKMDTLINGLLQISRTGRMTMKIKKVDMNQLLKTIIATHNFQITEISAKTIIENLTDCYGDENQLNQLFSNIIGNAIKYRDKNRPLTIEIASFTHFNKVIYSIKDNGIGIATRHLEKIWDVFFRVDSSLPEAGEGIGLSLAKRIAEKHKCKIWAESEVGKGSTFFIELQKDEFLE